MLAARFAAMITTIIEVPMGSSSALAAHQHQLLLPNTLVHTRRDATWRVGDLGIFDVFKVQPGACSIGLRISPAPLAESDVV